MRSPRALLTVLMLCVLALVAALYLLFFGEWIAAAVIGGVAVVAFGIAQTRLRRVDPSQLSSLSARSQRWLEVWARSVGRAGGGWDLPRRPKKD